MLCADQLPKFEALVRRTANAENRIACCQQFRFFFFYFRSSSTFTRLRRMLCFANMSLAFLWYSPAHLGVAIASRLVGRVLIFFFHLFIRLATNRSCKEQTWSPRSAASDGLAVLSPPHFHLQTTCFPTRIAQAYIYFPKQ